MLLQADAGQQFLRLEVGLVPVDEAALGALVAEEDVLGDREVGAEGQLLVDDDDAGGLAVVANLVEQVEQRVEREQVGGVERGGGGGAAI